jgi:hypothetical protein
VPIIVLLFNRAPLGHVTDAPPGAVGLLRSMKPDPQSSGSVRLPYIPARSMTLLAKSTIRPEDAQNPIRHLGLERGFPPSIAVQTAALEFANSVSSSTAVSAGGCGGDGRCWPCAAWGRPEWERDRRLTPTLPVRQLRPSVQHAGRRPNPRPPSVRPGNHLHPGWR